MLAAASDLLLAGACIAAAMLRLRQPPRAGRGMMLIGWSVLALAAIIGALRYVLLPELAAVHRTAADLGAGFGMPAVVLGLLLGWRVSSARTDIVLLAALAAIYAGAALADQPRLPGTVITLLAAIAAAALAPRSARLAAVLSLIALLASAGFALGLPQTSAIVGLHVALAIVQLGWCCAAAFGQRVEATWRTRSAQMA
jgi:hypothetical protein